MNGVGLIIQDDGRGSIKLFECNSENGVVFEDTPIASLPCGMPTGDFIAAIASVTRTQANFPYDNTQFNPVAPATFAESGLNSLGKGRW